MNEQIEPDDEVPEMSVKQVIKTLSDPEKFAKVWKRGTLAGLVQQQLDHVARKRDRSGERR